MLSSNFFFPFAYSMLSPVFGRVSAGNGSFLLELVSGLARVKFWPGVQFN